MKKHSHMKWSWIFMILFLTLSVIDFRFGILGFICMGAPVYHAVRGRGKIHCSKFCPRGSLLGIFLKNISLNQKAPKFMFTRKFKNGLLILMLSVFSFAMYHAGGDPNKIAFAMFRFMSSSLIIGIIMGIVFKPRSWCGVCPMGHGTVLIDQQMKKRNPKVVFQSK
ncbi:MAG: 4Fe-4S binding protein [Clostridiales bacterium]|nr:4Fe-4S binding protein [Clostridiales bacterium]